MFSLHRILLSLFILLYSTISFAQKVSEEEKNRILEQRIELIAEENEEDELDYSHLTDILNFYFDHPLDLNRASADDFQELGLFSNGQISALQAHIEKFGPLLTVYELQVIQGFDRYDYEILRPFIKVSRELDQSTISPRAILKNGNHEFFVLSSRILEKQKGYLPFEEGEEGSLNSRYFGNPYRIYSRYRFRYKNNLSFGLTGEKDAGEHFFNETQSGFDF